MTNLTERTPGGVDKKNQSEAAMRFCAFALCQTPTQHSASIAAFAARNHTIQTCIDELRRRH